MKILQIAVGVSASKVYHKLFSEYKKVDLNFAVYVPLHQNNQIKEIEQSEFPFSYYSNRIIKPYDKFVYYTKIKRMVRDIEKNFTLSEYNLIHAHSLFSDGAVAYELYKKYNIPYVVAVRNYDVNKYFKYAFHLKNYGLEILKNAEKIIFISPSYKEFVINKYVPEKYINEILSKVKIIPNGLDDFWLNKVNSKLNSISSKELELLFVGRIDENKNLNTVIQVAKLLSRKGVKSRLNIVGEGPLRQSLQHKNKDEANIHFHGAIHEKDTLLKLYKQNDILLVPSFTETFGLVYLEAMSCGLPVIYTKNQGFDGFFNDGEVGYSVNPSNNYEIVEAIEKILNNYKNISNNCKNSVGKFKWEYISKEYVDIYSIYNGG